jgi:hypothetical protein
MLLICVHFILKGEEKIMAATKVNAKIELQYGDKAVTDDQLISKAKKAYGGKDIKSLDIYVKPEESKAYYVVNGDVTGSVEL